MKGNRDKGRGEKMEESERGRKRGGKWTVGETQVVREEKGGESKRMRLKETQKRG